jgi:hypothetical protein
MGENTKSITAEHVRLLSNIHLLNNPFHSRHHSHTTFPSKTMALRLGTTLRGSKYSFRLVKKLGDKTVFSPVFKAEVLPGVQSLLPKNRWCVYNSVALGVCVKSRTRAVVKSADLENQTQVDCLVKEYKYYQKRSIKLSRNFRKLCGIINDPIR